MDNKELLVDLSAKMIKDKDLLFEVLEATIKAERSLKSAAVETLESMIRANGIHYRSHFTINSDKEKMVRELDKYILERIAYCYIYDVGQADYRIFDAISGFCAQTTKEQYQNLQFYALMNFGVRLIDIFDLKEKISAKLDKV